MLCLVQERHGCTLYSDNGNVGDAHTTCEKPPNIPAGYSIRDPNVSSLTLERYLEGRRDVLLLKMDVEGHEGQVCAVPVSSSTFLYGHEQRKPNAAAAFSACRSWKLYLATIGAYYIKC